MQHAITDDLNTLLAVLPPRIREAISRLEDRGELLEIILDLGRVPEARFAHREVILSQDVIAAQDLAYVVERIGEFGGDNRAGIERTLHRISAIRNRRGEVIGLTCRVGRAVRGTVALIRDVIEQGRSILILGRPGVGKTTLLREAARVLADELGKRVVVVDTSNEIAGDGDVPHPGIGRARRMQVARPAEQHQVMIEAVENHMPEVIVIDEIGTELEAAAARTIAERGVQLVGTAHGRTLENLLMNPTLSDLVGGVQAVTLGDEEARRRGTQKTVLERKAPPTFDVLVEQQSWQEVSIHTDVAEAVDDILRGQQPIVEMRERDEHDHVTVRRRAGEPSPEAQRSFHTDSLLYDMRHGNRGDRRMRGGSRGGGRTPLRLRPDVDGYDQRELREEVSEALALEEVEPTGTMGMPPVPRQPQPVRIYPFGINRDRLEESARQLNVPVEISHDQRNADAVIALKTVYRRQSSRLRDAEIGRKPIYVLRTNTMAQMQECLARIFELRPSERAAAGNGTRNPTMTAMQEAEDAIHYLLSTGTEQVELTPQTSYVRRLQHQIAGRYNLSSHSRGKEPNRRVHIFAR